jgi:hypothetical protein
MIGASWALDVLYHGRRSGEGMTGDMTDEEVTDEV